VEPTCQACFEWLADPYMYLLMYRYTHRFSYLSMYQPPEQYYPMHQHVVLVLHCTVYVN
jgi:hypothetical protein